MIRITQLHTTFAMRNRDWHTRTGHTLVLSADSHMLLELDELGEQVSFMTLLSGFNGLKKTIPRAEGVAIDEHGTLYMVSEPNLFYRFEKNAKKP